MPTVLVLAAQRTGVVNPLAQRAGVSHKCLVPICGKPLIVHVMDALASLPAGTRVRIIVEPEVHEELAALLRPYDEHGLRVEFVSSSTNIAQSVLIGAEGQQTPFLITTADNVLLTPEAIADTLVALQEADAVVNLATKTSVQAVHPRAQRRFYEFRDEGYANCNLYGIGSERALRAVEAFREGGQFMKNPKRLITAFGMFNIILFRCKLLALQSAMKRISRHFGLRIRALVPEDGTQAVDVDNEQTYEVAEMVLTKRGHA